MTLKVVPIDAPFGPSSLSSLPQPISPSRGRVYPPDDSSEAVNVYFDPFDLLTYAIVTIPIYIKIVVSNVGGQNDGFQKHG